jgi:ribokinase
MASPVPKIVVISSFMMDLTTKLKRCPRRGETVFGYDFKIGPGGKGSNAAVCAKRLGAQVTIIAKLGDDLFGKEALKSYRKEGLDTAFVFIDPEHATGVAPIFVEDSGENIIAIIPGANSHLTPKEVEKGMKKIKSARVLLVNLEVPVETAAHALKLAKAHNVSTILNPAPAPPEPLDESIYRFVDVLTPNETEALGALGRAGRASGVEGPDTRGPAEFSPAGAQEMLQPPSAFEHPSAAEQPAAALDFDARGTAESLIAKGVKNVVITMGQNGAYFMNAAESGYVQSFKVNTIDATGAGDAFNGALAVALGEGKSIRNAVSYANMVAALSTTRFGTAPSMPYKEEVEKWKSFAHATELKLEKE